MVFCLNSTVEIIEIVKSWHIDKTSVIKIAEIIAA